MARLLLLLQHCTGMISAYIGESARCPTTHTYTRTHTHTHTGREIVRVCGALPASA